MNDGRFRELSHTADAGIEAYGSSIEEAFENTALGLVQLSGVEGCRSDDEKEVTFSAGCREDLLVDFLNEILFLLNSDSWIPANFECDISDKRLRVRMKGTASSAGDSLTEVKAATYHNLKIEKEGGRWKIRVFFDL